MRSTRASRAGGSTCERLVGSLTTVYVQRPMRRWLHSAVLIDGSPVLMRTGTRWRAGAGSAPAEHRNAADVELRWVNTCGNRCVARRELAVTWTAPYSGSSGESDWRSKGSCAHGQRSGSPAQHGDLCRLNHGIPFAPEPERRFASRLFLHLLAVSAQQLSQALRHARSDAGGGVLAVSTAVSTGPLRTSGALWWLPSSLPGSKLSGLAAA